MIYLTNISLISAISATFITGVFAQNIAKPETHPYAKASGEREAWALSSEGPNKSRIYDFYRRQAEYYLSLPEEEIPKIIPAFPGLDGGKFGHWGRYHKNNHQDTRWNSIVLGEVWAIPTSASDIKVEKAVNVRLPGSGDLAVAFDPIALEYPIIWSTDAKNIVATTPFRWGLARNGKIVGSVKLRTKKAQLPAPKDYAVYRGYHRTSAGIVFDYDLAGKATLDRPGQAVIKNETAFVRTLSFQNGIAATQLRLCAVPKSTTEKNGAFEAGTQSTVVVLQGAKGQVIQKDNELFLNLANASEKTLAQITIWRGAKEDAQSARKEIEARPMTEISLKDFAPEQWTDIPEYRVTKKTGKGAYLIDEIPVPLKNPYQAPMMFSGIAFYDDGTAAISTLMGDIWLVKGLGEKDEKVTWKRFASGISIPFGLQVVNGDLYVAGKHQISLIRDENGDGEADFIGNVFNRYLDDHGHPHLYGLSIAEDGMIYIIMEFEVARIDSKKGTMEMMGGGVRNCMGFGSAKLEGEEMILIAPQEGDWTPASMIIRPRKNEFYGFHPKQKKLATVGLPLCYIPRGVDNSTGGFTQVQSERWGPLGDSVIGWSYGYGTHYRVLYDGSGPRGQAAVVPLPGEFRAGAVRGAVSPRDGQVYVVGTEGWGNYALQDGSLSRVRYAGGELVIPEGFQIFQNGIRLDFNEPLDAPSVQELRHIFVQQWNYEYAKRYGSPEFSALNPSSLGHDRLEVNSVTLLENGRSVFVELKDLQPVMQLHIHGQWKTAKGHDAQTDFFTSVIELTEAYQLKGSAPVANTLPKQLVPRIRGVKPSDQLKDQKLPDESWAGARKMEVATVDGLKFSPAQLKGKAGEKIAFTLINKDIMPHNWVLTKTDAKKAVGDASFRMLNDPDAMAKSYVPAEAREKVIAYTAVISPEAKQTIYFQLPEKAGNYPFICTFPGHWQIMQGSIEVTE